MTESLRTLLATPGIHRQIGCSESTVSRWRTDPNRRPLAAYIAPLVALAPELASEILAWCQPFTPPKPREVPKPKPADPMKLVAFRLPGEMIDAVDAIIAPGEDRSAVVRAGVAREVKRRQNELARRERDRARRDDLESRPDTRHHADDCRTEGTALDHGCPRCAARVGV